jgi:hypothetical protein
MKTNPTRQTSVKLVEIITSSDSQKRGGEPVAIGSEIEKVLAKIKKRMGAIGVLRSRMKRNLNYEILFLLAQRDPRFAEVFWKHHLGKKGEMEIQFTLPLS